MKSSGTSLTRTQKVTLKIIRVIAAVFIFIGLVLTGVYAATAFFGVTDPFLLRLAPTGVPGLLFSVTAMALSFGAENKELRARK